MDFPSGVALAMSRKPIFVTSNSNSNPDQLDCNFYVKAYKDVKPRFVNIFTHYYTIGQQEERLPNAAIFRELYPLFNLEMYRQSNTDLARLTPEELMSHFHSRGRFECRSYR
uniref:Uncharacterized protein n=1 Tax=viral metagenome TaxID=1070528 RepID=A0A6C0BKC3_9ZZZZ